MERCYHKMDADSQDFEKVRCGGCHLVVLVKVDVGTAHRLEEVHMQ